MERELTKEEFKAKRDEFNEKWEKTNYYWYPLDSTDIKDIIALNTNDFFKDGNEDKLKETINCSIYQHFYEIGESEDDTSFFCDRDDLDIYQASERYWFPEDYSWVIYSSHESSITFAGDWIIKIIKEIIPDYETKAWRTL